jgi:putative SOS response-associated peptidase YedK
MVLMRWGMPPPPRTDGSPVTNIRNIIAALAHVAKAGEPMLGPGQQLR